MPQITRREVITATLAGAAVAMARPQVAWADKSTDGLAKLIQTMEGFRTKMPPPQGWGEMNGLTFKELEPYVTNHLEGVAKRLGAKSRADCMALLTYLNDPDLKLRYIAETAIYEAVDGDRNGMNVSMSDILDVRSEGHLKMVRQLVVLIDKLSGE